MSQIGERVSETCVLHTSVANPKFQTRSQLTTLCLHGLCGRSSGVQEDAGMSDLQVAALASKTRNHHAAELPPKLFFLLVPGIR